MAKMNYRRLWYNDRSRRYGSINIKDEKDPPLKPKEPPKCARLFCSACGDPFFAYPWRLNKILGGQLPKLCKPCSGCREIPYQKPNLGRSSSSAVTSAGTSGQRNKSILVPPPLPHSHGISKGPQPQKKQKSNKQSWIKQDLTKNDPETEPVLLREQAALLSRAS